MKEEPVWTTLGATTEWVQGIAYPVFPRENGPREGDCVAEIISSVHGHFNCIWDPNVPSEVEDAKTAFEKAKSQGRRPFYVGENGKESTPMGEFDPRCGKMIILAPIVGG